MNRIIISALVGCVITSAVGGFGAPLLCTGSGSECSDRWRQAAGGALAAATFLGALLARLPGGPNP